MRKTIVIGSNHAGTVCVKTLRRLCPQDELTVIDRNDNISFLGCGMALWIGNQISGPDGLFYSDREQLEGLGAKVFMESEVKSIDFEAKTIEMENKSGGRISECYDRLILATGSVPVLPAVPGRDLKNVMQVKVFQDAQKIIATLKESGINRVVVVGAGYIGVELAEAFERHGKEVTLIDMAPTTLSAYYDEQFAVLIDEQLRRKGIRLALGQRVAALEGQTRVERVRTDQGEYPADLVIFCIGFRPNTDLAKEQLACFSNGAYLVDKHQRTSREDVYAIGDCATVYDNSIDGSNYIALATNAVRSGIVAAYNVAGQPMESVGVQGSNGISIYGFNMVATGLSEKKAQQLGLPVAVVDFTDQQKPDFMKENNHEVKIRIVYRRDNRVIVGAQMASAHDISMGIHLFSLAIMKKVTIDELKLLDIFFLPHFNKPYNYITMAALQAA